MMYGQQKTVYDQAVDITTEYLGPAAQRFIDRHIEAHISKPPDQITPNDLSKIMKWATAAMGVLTDDQRLVNAFKNDMSKLIAK